MSLFTIHQPTIYPSCYLVSRWMACHNLVLIGDADITPWQTQYWIYINGVLRKFGVPIVKNEGDVSVDQAKFSEYDRMVKKLCKTIRQENPKAPYLNRVLGYINVVEDFRTFGEYSTIFLRRLFNDMEVSTVITHVKELGVSNDYVNPTDRLVEIGKKMDEPRFYYTAMDAPVKYLNVATFEKAGIGVKYQDFRFHSSVPLDPKCSILELLLRYSFKDCVRALKGKEV